MTRITIDIIDSGVGHGAGFGAVPETSNRETVGGSDSEARSRG